MIELNRLGARHVHRWLWTRHRQAHGPIYHRRWNVPGDMLRFLVYCQCEPTLQYFNEQPLHLGRTVELDLHYVIDVHRRSLVRLFISSALQSFAFILIQFTHA